eukprot:12702730-Alexandrium_andersonii.AAC.1
MRVHAHVYADAQASVSRQRQHTHTCAQTPGSTSMHTQQSSIATNQEATGGGGGLCKDAELRGMTRRRLG